MKLDPIGTCGATLVNGEPCGLKAYGTLAGVKLCNRHRGRILRLEKKSLDRWFWPPESVEKTS